MENQMRKNAKSPNTSNLEPGDRVTYTIDTIHGAQKRVGKILFMDGSWCVVRLRSKKLVWVSLRGL